MAFHFVTPPEVRCAALPANMRKPLLKVSEGHSSESESSHTGLKAVTLDPSYGDV
jgi:hypothetical protein